MNWQEAQIFNEAISFAVFLDSATPAQGAPLAVLHKRFAGIWRRYLENQPELRSPSISSYEPQVYGPLLLMKGSQ